MNGLEILAAALVLDAVLGEPDAVWRRVPHPVAFAGNVIGRLEARYNAGGNRRLRGALVVAVLGVASLVAGMAVHAVPDGGILEVILAASLLAQKSLADHVRDVAAALRDSLDSGRSSVSRIVGRDPAQLDEAGVARAAIESAAENFSDGVVAPAFWFAVAGLPGLLLCKVVNTADSMIGHRDDRFGEFGWAAARLDDVMNWVPARLSAGLIALAHGSADALRVMRRDARRHRSPNAGWPEAAMAGVLGVALSGPRSYAGRLQDFPYVNGAGRRHAGPWDVEASVRAIWRSWAVLLAAVVAGFVLT